MGKQIMLDLIYWLGQIIIVELEITFIVAILVLSILWIIGAFVEILYKIIDYKE